MSLPYSVVSVYKRGKAAMSQEYSHLGNTYTWALSIKHSYRVSVHVSFYTLKVKHSMQLIKMIVWIKLGYFEVQPTDRLTLTG